MSKANANPFSKGISQLSKYTKDYGKIINTIIVKKSIEDYYGFGGSPCCLFVELFYIVSPPRR